MEGNLGHDKHICGAGARQITRQIKRNKRTHKREQVKKIPGKSRDNPDKPRGQSMKSLTVNISKIFIKIIREIYPDVRFRVKVKPLN